MSTLNVKLFRQITQRILAEPSCYSQKDFRLPKKGVSCGTAACVAGWAVLLGDNIPQKDWPTFYPVGGWQHRAAQLLGLTKKQAWGGLFSSDPSADWPKPFATKWARASTPRARATLAAARIKHLIQAGE